jgi:hypothetical protein
MPNILVNALFKITQQPAEFLQAYCCEIAVQGNWNSHFSSSSVNGLAYTELFWVPHKVALAVLGEEIEVCLRMSSTSYIPSI